MRRTSQDDATRNRMDEFIENISPCDHRVTCLTDVGLFLDFNNNYQLSVGICTSNENDRVTGDDS